MTVHTITIGAGTLELGPEGTPTSLSSQTTSVKLVPSVDTGDPINVLSGEQVAGDRTESFTLSGTIVQDLGTVDGTTEWLFSHRGETVEFRFIPNTVADKEISGNLTVEAIEIGGDVKTKPTSDFEWQVVGVPVIAAAP